METAEIGITVNDAIGQGVISYIITIVVAALTAGMIWAVVYILDHMHHRREAAAKGAVPVKIAVTPEPEVVDETPRHVAAVAAAVYAYLGASRLVYIGEAAGRPVWASAGRAIHQTSHQPKRAPK